MVNITRDELKKLIMEVAADVMPPSEDNQGPETRVQQRATRIKKQDVRQLDRAPVEAAFQELAQILQDKNPQQKADLVADMLTNRLQLDQQTINDIIFKLRG